MVGSRRPSRYNWVVRTDQSQLCKRSYENSQSFSDCCFLCDRCLRGKRCHLGSSSYGISASTVAPLGIPSDGTSNPMTGAECFAGLFRHLAKGESSVNGENRRKGTGLLPPRPVRAGPSVLLPWRR
jgi:hypothetical protein